MPFSRIDTVQKALAINLDSNVYGSFAEIGAGQEVARWFFRAGGAAGTVAKTISAYDMKVSDDLYGQHRRYVSRERLVAMLGNEFDLVTAHLAEYDADTRKYFAFSNTIAARNYAGTNYCHGWMGIRFQADPGGAANDIILHVNLYDNANHLQAEAVGILGVNLIHSAYHFTENPNDLFTHLFDDLSLERLEIDMVSLSGPVLESMNDATLPLLLLRNNLAQAVLYDQEGKLVLPSETFYKRPVLLERGTFSEDKSIYVDLLEAALGQFTHEPAKSEREPVALFELTMNDARGTKVSSDAELVQRIHTLRASGKFVMISNFGEGYHLSRFLRRYTKESIRFVVGIMAFHSIFTEHFYTDLEGGILEGLAQLFKEGIKIYVAPVSVDKYRQYLARTAADPKLWQAPDAELVSIDNFRMPGPLNPLFTYLRETGFIKHLEL